MSIHTAVSSCILAGVCFAFAFWPARAADSRDTTAKPAQATVVFVCKYGSAKSLWAADRFNKLAEQRGLAVRAIGRAANPGSFVHTRVLDGVVRGMALEGSNVADYKIKVLTPEEAAAATRLVHISLQGEPDPDSSVAAALHVPEERWEDVPSMLRGPDGAIDKSGRAYNQAVIQLLPRVDALFEEIANKPVSLGAVR
ncbi:MAG: hypothetical protein QOI40_2072 [Alphaproteobacteria bacterium]|jgi:hypothetical protein|nr:hypothetical protein [Alphaproteobacteria bacterium]